MASDTFEGKIIFFTAPSGSGKTTIVRKLLEKNNHLSFSISATTRQKRGKEVDKEDYYFLDLKTFQDKIAKDEFVEHEEVYEGLYYGTLKSEVERIWASGKHVLIDIDVKGGMSIKKCYPDKSLGVFIRLKGIDVLEKRLRDRGTESEEHIAKRLSRASYEMSYALHFDQILINDELGTAVAEAQELVDDFTS